VFKVVFSAVVAFLCVFVSKPFVHYLQLSGYKVRKDFLKTSLRLIKNNRKTPLKLTPRIMRFFIFEAIVSAILAFLLGWFAPLLLLSVSAKVLLTLALTAPLEAVIARHYIRKAVKKIKYRDLIVIGITGSAGKTSTKNILAQLLGTQFSVLASPHSFNTPSGFSRTINEHYNGQQILIMEMGARRVGDIAKLCKLTNPTYGIITTVNPQHLETFKTIENIAKTKEELARALPKNGFLVSNAENEFCRNFKSEAKIALVSSADAPETNLLGAHNALNIAAASAMARYLGISEEVIAETCLKLTQTPHRLELIKSQNGINILDDSYNANIDGAREALKVLRSFGGKRVVQTAGLVEQGKNSYNANFALGEEIAKNANVVILVGETNKTAILDGINATKETAEPLDVYTVLNNAEAMALYPKILKSGDALLIENDLPDGYK
jgi:UDP-N-acetylmuramoyl-tripeptide--D-alanyl-D-alanine ligase